MISNSSRFLFSPNHKCMVINSPIYQYKFNFVEDEKLMPYQFERHIYSIKNITTNAYGYILLIKFDFYGSTKLDDADQACKEN